MIYHSIILKKKENSYTKLYSNRTEIINFTLSKRRFSRVIYHAPHIQELLIKSKIIFFKTVYLVSLRYKQKQNSYSSELASSDHDYSPIPRASNDLTSALGTRYNLVHPPGKRTCTFLKRLIKRDKDERYVLERSLHPWSHLLSSRFLRAPSKAVKRLRPGHGPRTCVDTLHLYQ